MEDLEGFQIELEIDRLPLRVAGVHLEAAVVHLQIMDIAVALLLERSGSVVVAGKGRRSGEGERQCEPQRTAAQPSPSRRSVHEVPPC